MFAVFGEERLEYVDSITISVKLAEWKISKKIQNAYLKLFHNHELLTKIGYTAFKQYKELEFPTMHCAYILAICDILLNLKSSEIKYNDKSIIRCVNAFLVIISQNFNFKKHF